MVWPTLGSRTAKEQNIDHMIRRMRSGSKRIVNGILWEMSELITQERIAVTIFKLGGWIDHVTRHVRPLTKVKRSNVKVTRSCNVSAAITL